MVRQAPSDLCRDCGLDNEPKVPFINLLSGIPPIQLVRCDCETPILIRLHANRKLRDIDQSLQQVLDHGIRIVPARALRHQVKSR